MMSEWVDYKQVKETVDMQMVIDCYAVKGMLRNGDELRGPCPIHKGAKKDKTFTVNVRKNAFKCFSSDCGARGNVLDFVAAMEQCSVRDAALKLHEWFKIGERETRPLEDCSDVTEDPDILRGIYRDQDDAQFEVIATAMSAEHFEPLVVYRELFGEYQFWVAPPENFSGGNQLSDQPRFILVKAI